MATMYGEFTCAGTFFASLTAAPSCNAYKFTQIFPAGLARTVSAGRVDVDGDAWRARQAPTIELALDPAANSVNMLR